jgi:hypothetical protein
MNYDVYDLGRNRVGVISIGVNSNGSKPVPRSKSVKTYKTLEASEK